MSPAIQFPAPRRELARRFTGGVDVTLYWSAHDDSVILEIWHPATGETITLDVDGEHALDAFYHPFAHLKADSAAVA